MSDAPESLRRLQCWMQSVITHPAGIQAGIDSDSARRMLDIPATELERVLPPSQSQSSLERLAVYGNAYFARLLECLRSDFPLLQHAAGTEAFDSLAAGFLQRFPSASYTLNDLGASFPRYLEHTRPPRHGSSQTPDWADFLIDLARLERNYSEIFDGPGEELEPPLAVDQLVGIPPDRWERVRLAVARSLRLDTFRFPVHLYAAAVRRGESPEIPAPRLTCLALNRRDFVVQQYELNLFQFELLGQLQSGVPLAEALEHAVSASGDGGSSLERAVSETFQWWTASGFFLRAESR